MTSAVSRDGAWDHLARRYEDRGIALALGAGVSQGSQLPSWAGLLHRLAERIVGPEGASLVDRLRVDGLSLPAIAAVLKQLCPDTVHFGDLVREALYRNLPFTGRTPSDHEVVEYAHNNTTLRAVAALCAIRTNEGFEKNARIHGVLNFNLDSLLRAYAHARYGNPPILRTVERPSKSSNPRKISVYYMHGFVRFDAKAGDPDKEAPDRVVLTEHEYFDFFNNPTSLFTHSFLHYLREHPCLFVGLSMFDDNMRRLLYYSARDRYAACKEENRPFTWDEAVVRHYAVLREPPDAALALAHTVSLRSLGVRPLWVRSYDEIPDRFAAVYERGAASWSAVY